MKYTVRSVQTFDTPDGGGFNCTLLEDGKPVAKCHDAGNGWEVDFYWHDPTAQKRFAQHAAAQPPRLCEGLSDGLAHAIDTWVGHLVNAYVDNRKFTSMSKTKILFRVEGDREDEWRSIKRSEAAMAQLVLKYGAKLQLWEPTK